MSVPILKPTETSGIHIGEIVRRAVHRGMREGRDVERLNVSVSPQAWDTLLVVLHHDGTHTFMDPSKDGITATIRFYVGGLAVRVRADRRIAEFNHVHWSEP